jgi:hypothetical protein
VRTLILCCAVLCCVLLYSTSTSLFFYSRSRYSRYNDLFLLSLRRLGRPSTPASTISLRSIRFDDASCPSKASEIRSLRNSLCARSSNYRVKTRLPLLLLPRLQSSTYFLLRTQIYLKHKPTCKLHHPVPNAPLPIAVRLAPSLDHRPMFLFGPFHQRSRLEHRAPRQDLYSRPVLEG